MKLRELLALVSDQRYDIVSVYHTTETDFYHVLYEGAVIDCPDRLFERVIIGLYASQDMLCICLDGDEE